MIFVTGSTGFIGQALVPRLAQKSRVRISVRTKKGKEIIPYADAVFQKDLTATEDWADALTGVSEVVHCAARVHIMTEHALNPLMEFRRANVDGTLKLAQQAVVSGVKRFIFLSSIKVNGEQTLPGETFRADQYANPRDPYGVSKMEAEEGLRALASKTGMEVVIIRPPLVYGSDVKANFLVMMRWLWRGIPLPLGAITENRRSFVALDNLLDLITTCIDHPAAANQTFLVSDDEDLSTAELLQRLGKALERPARLFSVPISLLKLGANVMGRPEIVQRLCGSLQVDVSKTKEILGWSPPINVDEGLRQVAQHWLNMCRASAR